MGKKTIVIYPTFKCSLGCSYCFQARREFQSYKDSDSNTYRHPFVLSNLLRPPKGGLLDGVQKMDIAFVGGECLEEPKIINGCLNACSGQAAWYNYRFIFVTNGKHLLDDNIKELFVKASALGSVMIKLSFDDEKKKPQLLGEATYEYLKNYYHNAYYVIKGQDTIERDIENIKFLNARGINPIMTYNIYTRSELFETEAQERLRKLLRAVNYGCDYGYKNICGYSFILPSGEVKNCHKAYRKTEAEIKKSREKCQQCEFVNKCSICVYEQEDSYCEFKKILVDEYCKKQAVNQT